MGRQIRLIKDKATRKFIVLAKGIPRDSSTSRRIAINKQKKFLARGIPSVVVKNISSFKKKKKRKGGK